MELPSDRGGKHEFVSLVRDLSPPGELGAPVSEEKKEEEERGVFFFFFSFFPFFAVRGFFFFF